MSRYAILLVLIVAVAATNALPQQQTKCGANQVFDACGSECQASCQTPNPGVCTLRCVPGCHCAEGFVRNSAGNCVLTRDC